MKKIIAPLFLSTLACAAQAATITVNDAFDGSVSGKCTLRDAVQAINNGSDVSGCTGTGYGSGDTIVFSLSPGSEIVVASSGHIEIQKDLIINAPAGGITLDANPNLGGAPSSNRIFYVSGGTSLSITGVRFINGNEVSNTGGAILVNMPSSNYTLTLEDCAFVNNQALTGGAVHMAVDHTSNATIRNSTFNGNMTTGDGATGGGSGGAVHTPNAAISNSTFEDNEATVSGGAVFTIYSATINDSTFDGNTGGTAGGVGSGGAVHSNSRATISNSTFNGNHARSGGAVSANTLDARHLTLMGNTAAYNAGGQALSISSNSTLHNSIIIGSNGSNGNTQCVTNSGTFTGSHNLEGWVDASGAWQASTTTCGSSNPVSIGAASNLNDIFTTTTPVDNGGPTHTLKLSAGSPAIGAADPAGGTSQMWDFNNDVWTDATLDQRGYGRATDPGNRSIGAFEGIRTPPFGSGTPIPALPAPLLLMLAAVLGAAATRQRRR